ncbi:hypothetical protein tpqmel_0086 [Candidatus Gastranaerophilus sp. (ex Termes propinquus)]|nr:hypothetical protein tpqmel_0086 [Candidatus Gastranaerophilus sp. (ex Termes propinquus)]
MLYEQITPKTPDVYLSIANCYKMTKNYDRAVAYMNSAIKLDPADSDLYYNLALIYLDKKDLKGAQRSLDKAVGLNKHNIKAVKLAKHVAQRGTDEALNKAHSAFEKRNYQETLKILFEAQKKDPQEPQIYYYIGRTYDAQGKYPQAMENYQATLKADRNFDAAYFAIAQILERYGRGKDALEAYERFLGGDSRDKDMIKKAQERMLELSKIYY